MVGDVLVATCLLIITCIDRSSCWKADLVVVVMVVALPSLLVVMLWVRFMVVMCLRWQAEADLQC